MPVSLNATQKKQLTAARKLLKNKDWLVVRQGLDLLEQQADPALWDALADGMVQQERGNLVFPPTTEIGQHIKPPHQTDVALLALSHSSQANAVTTLDVPITERVPMDVLTRFPRLHTARLLVERAAGYAGLSKLSGLKSLDLGWDLSESGLSALAGLTGLVTLRLLGWDGLTDLSPLSGLPCLRELELLGARDLADLGGIAGLKLESLVVQKNRGISDLRPLATLPGLKRLALDQLARMPSLEPLKDCVGLESLMVGYYLGENPNCIGQIPSLKNLKLWFARSALPHDFLVGNTSIEGLTLDNWDKPIDWVPNARLKTLEIVGGGGEFSCQPLTKLRGLESLALTRIPSLTAFPDLGENPALRSVSLISCPKLSDISALAKCPNLEQIALTGCREVKDIRPLLALPRLKHFEAPWGTSFPPEQLVELQEKIAQN